MEQKSKSAKAEAKAKVHDPVKIDRQKKFEADFVKKVLSTYDGFISQGIPVKKAISMTNSALKAKSHPWAVYHITFDTLRAYGRFKGVKLYQKKGTGES